MNLNNNLLNFSDYLNKPSNIDFTFENVNKFCFLGIIIDENLTMQNHVEMVTNKLSKITGKILQ